MKPTDRKLANVQFNPTEIEVPAKSNAIFYSETEDFAKQKSDLYHKYYNYLQDKKIF